LKYDACSLVREEERLSRGWGYLCNFRDVRDSGR